MESYDGWPLGDHRSRTTGGGNCWQDDRRELVRGWGSWQEDGGGKWRGTSDTTDRDADLWSVAAASAAQRER